MHSTETTRRTKRRAGFSLIELMAVILIIGLLAGLVAYNVGGIFAQSNVDVAKLQIQKLTDNMELFIKRNGGLPSTEQGLAALTAPSEETGEAILAESQIIDPWNNPFVFLPSSDGTRSFEIISLGADGKEGGVGEAQDISSADIDG